MDGLEFTSKLIEHGAWPVLAAYVAITHGAAIERLIDRINRLKVGSAQADFAAKAEEVAEKAGVLEARPVETPKLEAALLQHVVRDAVAGFDAANSSQARDAGYPSDHGVQGALDKTARDDQLRASGLIIEEWARLDSSIRQLASSKLGIKTRNLTIAAVLHELNRFGVISDATADSVKDLQKLRNLVAHSQFEPTRESGENFAASCLKVENRIGEEEAAWRKAVASLDAMSSAKP